MINSWKDIAGGNWLKDHHLPIQLSALFQFATPYLYIVEMILVLIFQPCRVYLNKCPIDTLNNILTRNINMLKGRKISLSNLLRDISLIR